VKCSKVENHNGHVLDVVYNGVEYVVRKGWENVHAMFYILQNTCTLLSFKNKSIHFSSHSLLNNVQQHV